MGQVLEKHNITLTKQKKELNSTVHLYELLLLKIYIAINLCLKIINCRKWLIISNIYALKQCLHGLHYDAIYICDFISSLSAQLSIIVLYCIVLYCSWVSLVSGLCCQCCHAVSAPICLSQP